MTSLYVKAVAVVLVSMQWCEGIAGEGEEPVVGIQVYHDGVKQRVDTDVAGRSLRGLNPDSVSSTTLSLNLEYLWDQIPAWPGLVGSRLTRPPLFLQSLPTVLGNWRLPAGLEVVYTCPNEAEIEVCDAWMFYYSCPHTCVGTYQGGLPGLLAISGWERTLCAPGFVTGPVGTGYVHPMKSFRKQLARGESVSFTLPLDTEFVAFGLDRHGVDCGKFNTAVGCGTAGQRCKWEGMTCIPQDCRVGRGPPPPCAECPWLGLETRPAVDGPFGGPQ